MPSNTLVPATVDYTASTRTATLTPSSALAQRSDLHGDGPRGEQWRLKDGAGNALGEYLLPGRLPRGQYLLQ